MLFAQNDILDKSISAILGAAGGMAVPSLMLWHLLRTFIPEERKAFLLTQEKIVAELAEQRKACLVALKEVTDHCAAEIESVDKRWQQFMSIHRGEKDGR